MVVTILIHVVRKKNGQREIIKGELKLNEVISTIVLLVNCFYTVHKHYTMDLQTFLSFLKLIDLFFVLHYLADHLGK
jgi:hypothetical protein